MPRRVKSKNSLLHPTQIVVFEYWQLFELSSGLLEAAQPHKASHMRLISKFCKLGSSFCFEAKVYFAKVFLEVFIVV